jgi:ATP-binding cassette subfamily B (MDR/TAP) protein 1
LIATTIMAFVLTWRLAVIVLPALFMTLVLGYANFRFLTVFEDHLTAERDKQANFVAESANSIQLNASLTREAEVVRQFKLNYTSRPFKRGVLCASSFTLGGTQAMVQLFGALIFYWGALNVARGAVVRLDQSLRGALLMCQELADLFTIIECVVIAIYIGAKILTYSGDFTRMFMSLKAIQVRYLSMTLTRLTYRAGWTVFPRSIL